jgi:membrane protein DedA with SNARE-associated domain
MESVGFIQWCLDNLNYWTITLLMTIESSFIPFPSEVVVPPAAYKAAATGELNVWLVVLFATLGALMGALINYFLALWLGKPIVYAFANSRFGHMCLIDQKKVETAEQFFVKYGVAATLIGRLVPAVRQLISIPAGLARMNLAKFALFTALGAGAWNGVLAALGYYLESVVPEEQLLETVTRYSHEIGIGIILAVILVVGFLVYKGVKK